MHRQPWSLSEDVGRSLYHPRSNSLYCNRNPHGQVGLEHLRREAEK